jgi:hypothetical protein
MKVASIGLALRRRRMFEAADLGVRLVQARSRSVWATLWPAWAAAVAISALSATAWWWAPTIVLWWLKPWLDRSILFVLARAAFREETRFVELLAAGRTVWWRDLFNTLTVRRLSPWRAYVQPALQLEGQRGAARRARKLQILGPHRGVAMAVQSAFATVELCLVFGLGVLPGWLGAGPEGTDWFETVLRGAFEGETETTGWIEFAIYAAVVLFLEPFFVGAGFAMYLNRRVELEAWDIEQDFRVAFTARVEAGPTGAAPVGAS